MRAEEKKIMHDMLYCCNCPETLEHVSIGDSCGCMPHEIPLTVYSHFYFPEKIENNNTLWSMHSHRPVESAAASCSSLGLGTNVSHFFRFHSHFVTHMANFRNSDEIMAKYSVNAFEPQVSIVLAHRAQHPTHWTSVLKKSQLKNFMKCVRAWMEMKLL